MPSYLTQAARTARQVGPAGEKLLIAIGQHRVLTAPLCALLFHVHPATVRENISRMHALGLVYGLRNHSVPSEATRWYLTALGCRVARLLAGDPDWDPRVVERHMRRTAEDTQDLTIAELRIMIFAPHKQDLVVTRARGYVHNSEAVRADREYRAAMTAYERAWAAGEKGPPPREPESRRVLRRTLGLPLLDLLPIERGIIVPDLFLPEDAGGPVIVEVEVAQALGAHVRTKIAHLAAYQADHPATIVVVVYPAGADLPRLARVWRMAIRRGRAPLSVTLTSMSELRRPIQSVLGGLRLTDRLPGCHVQ